MEIVIIINSVLFIRNEGWESYRVKIWITVSKSLRVPALLNFSLQVENYKQVL
jgi:hypothetical protein